MKSIITGLFFFLVAAQAGLHAQEAQGNLIEWEQQQLDLGHIAKGDKVSKSYTFINISEQEVEIDLVSTCECTEAKWTQGKIGPGEEGKVEFTFDSAKKDVAEPIDVDVYFLNINPKSGRPYSSFLSYIFDFAE